MAKRSMLEREKKRARIVQKFANKRAALKAVIKNLNSPDDERWDAQMKLQMIFKHPRIINGIFNNGWTKII